MVRVRVVAALLLGAFLVGVPQARALQPGLAEVEDGEDKEPATLELPATLARRDPTQVAVHAEACRRGDRNACVELGHDYAFGAGGRQEPRRALEVYAKQCAPNFQLACAWEGFVLFNPAVRDVTRGRHLLETACRAGEAFGCYAEGLLAFLGKGEPKNFGRAAPLFRRGCEDGYLGACAAYAYTLDFGKGVKRDSRAASELLARTCSSGLGEACDHLGVLYWSGRGVGRDHERANALFDDACKHGSARGCAHEAQAAYTRGDKARARSLLEVSCAADDAVGCMFLGGWHKFYGAAVDAIDPLKRACHKDLAYACRELAFVYIEGKGVPTDEAVSEELFTRACELGEALSCVNQAIALRNRNDFSAALAPARKACKLDPSKRCGELAKLAYQGQGMRRNPSLAVSLWRKEADAGEVEGYMGLALAYEQGNGVKADLAKAADLYSKACNKDDLNACDLFADFLSKGKGVPRDAVSAFVLFERSCKAKDALACARVGWAYDSGEGVTPNAAKAVEFYTSACNDGQAVACLDAAMLFRHKKKDPKKSAPYLEQGCALKSADACVQLGIAYEEGVAFTRDDKRADELYDRGCTAGSALGCDRLARLRVEAKSEKVDYAGARSAAETACNAKYYDACHLLGYLWQQGLGGAKDPAKGRALIQKACDAGDAPSCRALAR